MIARALTRGSGDLPSSRRCPRSSRRCARGWSVPRAPSEGAVVVERGRLGGRRWRWPPPATAPQRARRRRGAARGLRRGGAGRPRRLGRAQPRPRHGAILIVASRVTDEEGTAREADADRVAAADARHRRAPGGGDERAGGSPTARARSAGWPSRPAPGSGGGRPRVGRLRRRRRGRGRSPGSSCARSAIAPTRPAAAAQPQPRLGRRRQPRPRAARPVRAIRARCRSSWRCASGSVSAPRCWRARPRRRCRPARPRGGAA